MSEAAIGIFDSGLGGLTVLPYLRQILPEERIIYFGDTARTPYGSKSEATIGAFATEITNFLLSQKIKALLIACNTVSAVAVDLLRERFPQLPIFGIIEPAIAEVAAVATEGEAVLILGTKATIHSDLYGLGLSHLRPDLCLSSIACPTWVPLLEEGVRSGALLDAAIDYHLPPETMAQADSLILGCTHYPLLAPELQRRYPEIKLYNPSAYLPEQLAQYLAEQGLKSPEKTEPDLFYASDLSDNFQKMIRELSEDSPFIVHAIELGN